jgi:hypothetical protein
LAFGVILVHVLIPAALIVGVAVIFWVSLCFARVFSPYQAGDLKWQDLAEQFRVKSAKLMVNSGDSLEIATIASIEIPRWRGDVQVRVGRAEWFDSVEKSRVGSSNAHAWEFPHYLILRPCSQDSLQLVHMDGSCYGGSIIKIQFVHAEQT